MSWEEQAYSFGNPNAQPPTPTRTPTSGAFSSPTFQTPRASIKTLEDRTGWTPTFAEEYSVFNATPGRLTNTGGPFDIATPRPSTGSSQNGPLPNAADLEAELASHVHHIVQTNLPLPLVEPSLQLSSSPRDASLHGTGFYDKNLVVTPRKPRRRLEEAFSGQTATPPQSAAKSSRKLAPKPEMETMQQDEEPLHPSSSTSGLPNILTFSHGPDNMFSYPMSAPATAHDYTNTKSFWDPDTSMSGMEMDMSFAATNDAMFNASMSHKAGNVIDWDRSPQIFQDSGDIPPYTQNISRTSGIQRTIISKASMLGAAQEVSGTAYSFDSSPISEDPFVLAASSGAVDPGLIFAFHETTHADMSTPTSGPSTTAYSHSITVPPVMEPYQHQQRESRRDQEELRRTRSSKNKNATTRFDVPSLSSPSKKSSRPGIQRSASDSRARIGQTKKQGQLSNIAPRPGSAEMRTAPNRGRISPVKHQHRMSLSSIPESVPGTRTSLTFSIDVNGRARTETKIIVDDPIAVQRRSSLSVSEDWDSSHSGSSSDEEPIILPSRSTSFSLPSRRPEGPRLARFDVSRQSIDESSRISGASRDQLSDDQESEAETVVDEYEGAGDATNALRKVMESRTQRGKPPSSSQHHVYSTGSDRIRAVSQSTPGNIRFSNSGSSTNLSPTTMSDPDLATPSTDRESSRSDSTRCICNSRDGDTFMIQCESCEKWLHAKCVGIRPDRLPNVYICAFCAQTPNMRGGRIREPARRARLASSPLAHKSFKSWR